MKYSRVFVQSLGYELAPMVVTSMELEDRLAPAYKRLHIPTGQLEALTGVVERRWWEPRFPVSEGAIRAGRKALTQANLTGTDLGALVYAGVCRELFEPATACKVAAALGVKDSTAVYDISNACLGVLNGMLDIANRIELGQIRAGMVVSCESARDIVDIAVDKLLAEPSLDAFRLSLATLTGGSGAAAVLLTDGSFADTSTRLLGGVTRTAPEHHQLCRWGMEATGPNAFREFMSTDSVGVLQHGVALGRITWQALMHEMSWTPTDVDKVICHQVGSAHRDTILKTLEVPEEADFSTYEFLGNMGTVSLPLTAALAGEREFLERGDRIGFLGIGSGLNCLMLGVGW